ncbi:Fe-S oxidoreductase [Coniosporium apollinis]|uniref:tRNA 4-demethylwyosine synthase (AdoMet-dependent) n=1 Tax=Coniosporium apollinis TaxID=61459 RepID=A0ABQ9P4Q1_9PEZI|nr:Fe-S oxidoreductase [Coniosporium apollinis]
MLPTSLYMLPSDLLSVWHSYRLPILLSAIALLTILRVAVHLRQNREKLSLSPLPGSPAQLPETKDPLFLAPGAVERATINDGHLKDITITEPPLVRPKPSPKRVTGSRVPRQASKRTVDFDSEEDSIQPLVFFSSLSGTTEQAAKSLVEDLDAWRGVSAPRILQPQLHDLSYVDYDDFFVSPPNSAPSTKYFYIVLLPTYNIDTSLDPFLEHLKETHHDFRIDTAPLSGLLGYSVFGFGDREGWPTEEEGFCSQAKEVDKWLARLTGRKRAFPLGMGDVRSDARQRLLEWRLGVQEVLRDIASGKGLGEGIPGSGAAVESDEEDVDDAEDDGAEESETPRKARKPKKSARVDDLEDLGRMVKSSTSGDPSSPLAIDFTTYKSISTATPAPLKDMVPATSPTYAALTKQGYTIVGSHSGVKICRWTKSALRGRGSCYKYSFYGIASHQCMETTPSLSCSNKCVFCWRHGTNPVGTTWRWKVDPPELIFSGVKEGHYRKIKMMRGVPGVRAERFQEAMTIRHCALSLVGEPIFYPHINEFTAMLHAERISTFLVCNAQHPDQLATLKPVTQLYVSIDASNKDALRKIDRPLHRDFWERFLRCMDILREKRKEMRTVFRLTLVRGFNIDEEVTGYADLVERALPCFVEVKGVTFCGTSTSAAAGLTMQNVPWWHEVRTFVLALNDELNRRGLRYGLAAEHEHSCCALIGSEAFRDGEGRWCTRIDYGGFFRCLESGKPFGPEDYRGPPTPEWALWGRGGFDPRDVRVDRKGRVKE